MIGISSMGFAHHMTRVLNSTNELKTDCPCNLKLWLMYFLSIYAKKLAVEG